ncbi:conserved hypothetical Ustilaginaceae-specific protein [Sporisorium reilianum SRZ2]|uniref:Conserved hypothetical Ustilaginaceae-specific protein n=1 Tax=Sporisorium reilianum (strain SRZ2) TaxID=999809 RepID=E6ZUT4_SPORE|nr:conserved hypothetical Ustilaginaceae-specific protein [Sporisorium reilianum SRZ2]
MKVLLAKLVLAWLVLVTCCRAAGFIPLHEVARSNNELMLANLIQSANHNIRGTTSNPKFSQLSFGIILPAQAQPAQHLENLVREHVQQEDVELVRLGKHEGSSIFGIPWQVQYNDGHLADYVLLLEKRPRQPLRPMGFANTAHGTQFWLGDARNDGRVVRASQVNQHRYD